MSTKESYRVGVIGGGSVFTPELIEHFTRNYDRMAIREVCLMDIDPDRLHILAELSRRIIKRAGLPIIVTETTAYIDAINGSDYILLQLRAGGQDARITDEDLGLKYKLPFTETISVCGFATFLRSYPIYKELIGLIRKYAPSAWVLNFTNPSGILTELLFSNGIRNLAGVCNSSIGTLRLFGGLLGVDSSELFMNARGLNHLTFVDKVYYRGQNVFEEIISKLQDYKGVPFPVELIKTLGYLPNSYLQYYYLRESIVDKLQKQPMTRSRTVKELEKTLLSQYADPNLCVVPEGLKKRGGFGYALIVANLMKAIAMDEGSIHYVNVPNKNALPELPADAIVEIPVIAKAEALYPIVTDPLPDEARALVITMKSYEKSLVKAAEENSVSGLLKALMIHPLIGSYHVSRDLLSDVLKINRPYLGELFK